MQEMLSRFVGDIVGRIDGPMASRLILQPLIASMIAVRDGVEDAREGRPPYLATFVSRSFQRFRLLREAFKSILRVLLVAILFDAVYQALVYRWFYPVETLIVAFTLACLPYAVLRGSVTRMARMWRGAPGRRAGMS
jgi:hypothetical protein